MNENDALNLILSDAKDRPMDFIKLITLRALAHPEGRGILADALRDLGELYQAEADALRGEKTKTAQIIKLQPTT